MMNLHIYNEKLSNHATYVHQLDNKDFHRYMNSISAT